MQVWQKLMEAEILSALAPVDSYQPGKHRAGVTHGFPWWGYLIIGILVVFFFLYSCLFVGGLLGHGEQPWAHSRGWVVELHGLLGVLTEYQFRPYL
ncbi:hypothetical protein MKX03_020713 [Papaver bracteatum]|nr:hypothetical protein MKX03_020713 [Papaver bracteatum]